MLSRNILRKYLRRVRVHLFFTFIISPLDSKAHVNEEWDLFMLCGQLLKIAVFKVHAIS